MGGVLGHRQEADHAVLILDEKNQVVFANKHCEEILKRSIDGLQDQSMEFLFDREDHKQALRDLRMGKDEKMDMEFPFAGFVAKGTLAKMQGPAGEPWLLLDLEMKKAGSKSLKETQKDCAPERQLQSYLDQLLEASFDGIVISDSEANVLKANRAYEDLSGIRKSEIVGRNLEDLIREGVLKRAAVFEVTKTRVPTTMVHSYARTGKSAMVTGNPVFDQEGNLIYVVANFRDITQLRKMSKRLGYADILDSEGETLYLKPGLADQPDYGILVRNRRMKECLQRAVRVAQFDTHVLLLGESGVGKTKLAEIIHKASPRANGPFISINCGSIPETLLESELFGYERGAFTGASVQGKAGQFELASGGTLVLDEIGDLSLSLQVKLLKAIDEKKILKVGGTTTRKVDTRIIAVTNKDIRAMVEKNRFREDLFFRLSVVPIVVPPLRERADEIPLMVAYFFEHFNKKYGTQKHPDQELRLALNGYDYPGNVRELKNLVERLIVMSPENVITLEDFYSYSLECETILYRPKGREGFTLHKFLEECEKRLILKVVKEESSLRSAAKRLGVSGPTLWRKLKKFGMMKRMIEHRDDPRT